MVEKYSLAAAVCFWCSCVFGAAVFLVYLALKRASSWYLSDAVTTAELYINETVSLGSPVPTFFLVPQLAASAL